MSYSFPIYNWTAYADGLYRSADQDASEDNTINPNFYVVSVDAIGGNAAGNDTTGDGSLATPWATIQKACDTLVAGEGVYIRAGTYTEDISTSPDAGVRGIKPQNSGTLGNPITYEGYPGDAVHTAIIDQASDNLANGFFVADNKNYITIKGLQIRNCGRGVETPAGLTACTGLLVEDCWIHDCDVPSGANSAGVKLDNNIDAIVRNCKIHDTTVNGVANGNACGIQSYGMVNTIIEFCTIYNTNRPVYVKRANASGVRSMELRFCDLLGIDVGIELAVDGTGAPAQIDNYIHHNLIKTTGLGGVRAETLETVTLSTGLKVYKNTFIDCNLATSINGCQGVDIQDNIFSDATGRPQVQFEAPSTNLTTDYTSIITNLDYNLYLTANVQVDRNGAGQADITTLISVRAISGYGGLTDPTPEANGAEGTILFTNAGAGDYTLQGGSPGKSLALDGGDVGMWSNSTTQIGYVE